MKQKVHYYNEQLENQEKTELDNIVSYKAIERELYEQDKLNEFGRTPTASMFEIETVEIYLWHKNDGDIIKIGDPICTLKITRFINSKSIKIFSKQNGILRQERFVPNQYSKCLLKDGQKIFNILKSEGGNLYNIAKIEDFLYSGTQNLKWSKVGGNNMTDTNLNEFILTETNNSKRIFFTINNLKGKDFVIVRHPKSDYKIKKSDKLQFELESGVIIELYFQEYSKYVYNSSIKELGEILESKAVIINKDLIELSQTKVRQIQIIPKDNDAIITIRPYGFNHAYSSFSKLQQMIQLLFTDFLKETSSLKNYEPLQSYPTVDKKVEENCHVYLMLDSNTGYHKIGISNKPEYREKTLQSEKPTIELIISKSFPSRRIARSFEKALHESFNSKNVRGEWFNLDNEEVVQIKESFK